MSKLKFGFHLGSGGGNQNGIGDYWQRLNTAVIPTFTMSADAFPFDAQKLVLDYPTTGHTAVFRRSVAHNGSLPPSGNPDVPEYNLPPQEAAERHVGWHLAHRPSEMNGRATWLITENEIASRLEFDNEAQQTAVPLFDGLRERYTRTTADGSIVYGVTNAGWMAAYSTAAAHMAMAAGQKWAAFGWASGNPEPEDWTNPHMLDFLRLCAQYASVVGIAVHEYSWRTDDIWHGNRRLVGRLEDIFATCRQRGITPYPTVLVTEWGWALDDVPDPQTAMAHILSVSEFYAKFPTVKGAAIWYLGPGFGDIANKAQQLIAPLIDLTLATELNVEPYPQPDAPPPPQPGSVLGTDVSRWQGAIDFQRMADAGARFVYIKATQGKDWVDPAFADNWRKAGSAHWVDANGHVWPLLRGAYHYFLNNVPPDLQAAHMLATLPPGDAGELPLAGDFEEPSRLDAAVIARFQDAITYDGRKPVVYTGGWWTRQYLTGDKSVLAQYPLWHTPQRQPAPEPWSRIAIDQEPSTERGKEFGVSSPGIDLNRYQGSEANLLAWARLPQAERGKPREQYGRTYWLVQQAITKSDYLRLARLAWEKKRTLGFSADDAGIGALERKTAVIFDLPPTQHDTYRQWFRDNYPGTNLSFTTIADGEKPAETNYTSHMVGKPRGQYARTYWCLPQDTPLETFLAAAELAWAAKRTIGFSYDDAGLGDLARRTAVLFNIPVAQRGTFADWYHAHYPGVLVEFRDTAVPPPPPAAGTAVIGLHASADPGDLYGGDAEYNEFRDLRPGVIKILNAHSTASIVRLVTENPGAEWIIRAFLDFGGRHVTPQQFANWTLPDTRRAVEILRNHGVPATKIWVELHNEPNLTQEGLGASWADGRAFGEWLTAVRQLHKSALPDVKCIYPGLSPGGDVPGVRANSARFLADSAAAAQACDAIGVHCYWANGWPMSGALLHLDNHKYLNRPVWVTEASRNDRPSVVPPAAYAAEYVTFLVQLRQRPWVRGVTYFVASASNGYFAPECWVVNKQSKGIAAAIRGIMP